MMIIIFLSIIPVSDSVVNSKSVTECGGPYECRKIKDVPYPFWGSTSRDWYPLRTQWIPFVKAEQRARVPGPEDDWGFKRYDDHCKVGSIGSSLYCRIQPFWITISMTMLLVFTNSLCYTSVSISLWVLTTRKINSLAATTSVFTTPMTRTCRWFHSDRQLSLYFERSNSSWGLWRWCSGCAYGIETRIWRGFEL